MDLLEAAETAVKLCEKMGADETESFTRKQRVTEVVLERGEIQSERVKTQQGIGVRVPGQPIAIGPVRHLSLREASWPPIFGRSILDQKVSDQPGPRKKAATMRRMKTREAMAMKRLHRPRRSGASQVPVRFVSRSKYGAAMSRASSTRGTTAPNQAA